MSTVEVKSTARKERPLHPLPLRVMHWINAVAIFIMVGSGWRIYNDDVPTSLKFPTRLFLPSRRLVSNATDKLMQ